MDGGGSGAAASATPIDAALLSFLRAVGPLLSGAAITQSKSPHLPGHQPRSALEQQCATALAGRALRLHLTPAVDFA